MSRELLGEEPDPGDGAQPPGRVRHQDPEPTDPLVADLDGPAEPEPPPRQLPRQPGVQRSGLRLPGLRPAGLQLPGALSGVGRRSRPLVAIVVGVTFAAGVAVLTAYQQTQHAITRGAAEAGIVTAWPDLFTSPRDFDELGEPVQLNLHLMSSAAVPVTIERIDIADLKLNPDRPVTLQPGKQASAEFTFLADCAGLPETQSGTASARDQRGDPLRLPVTPVGNLLEALASSNCVQSLPVVVRDMVASRDGSLSFTLVGREGASPTRVGFGIGNGGSGSGSPNDAWSLEAKPDDRLLIQGSDEVAVRLQLRYRGCLADGTLPAAGQVIQVFARSLSGNEPEYLEGWDETTVAAAATAALVRNCD